MNTVEDIVVKKINEKKDVVIGLFEAQPFWC